MIVDVFFFFFKQKTAYEMRISDWSSDVCSSDLSVGATNKRWLSAEADVCCVVIIRRRGVVAGRSADEAHHTAVHPQSRAACRRCLFGTSVDDHVGDLVGRREAAEQAGQIGRAHV